MSAIRIVSVEMEDRDGHRIVAAVHADDGSGARRLTLRQVLAGMNSARRFYTQRDDGRVARVQRYRCGICGEDHVRTHLGDTAVQRLQDLELEPAAPRVA